VSHAGRIRTTMNDLPLLSMGPFQMIDI
jgi:hypothetical protein